MKRNINILVKESEDLIWKQITASTLRLSQKVDYLRERNFLGDFEDADEASKSWKKMSKNVIRLCFAHKSIKGIKHFFDKNKLFHNGDIIHPSYNNLFSIL